MALPVNRSEVKSKDMKDEFLDCRTEASPTTSMDFDESVEECFHPQITIGVCAMEKKTRAKPMQSILSRLESYEFIKITLFTDDIILNQAVEEWPLCDCLIAFYSGGFPLDKAIAYVDLRKPKLFNSLQEQYSLMDRREVYEILMKNGVEVPRHVVLNREDGNTKELVETDDLIEVDGQVFQKPFVEKPVSAEDHNIYIYFPSDYGGGSQRLFRKVNNRSSAYYKESSVRKDGSYIYEEFLATDGSDVKVYVVGPDYAHAEARKSPALDGKVARDLVGKEKRYPVLLNSMEKLIARKVSQAFKQTVCGFDMLRANGKSYVCDVNGFSFVKNSDKYYDDCAQILLEIVTANLAPEFIPRTPPSVEYLVKEVPELPVPIPKTGNMLELRCVVGVIRHGDRTPKQKMKMIVTHSSFIELFRELNGFVKGHIKIKKPKLLQRVLDISCDLLSDLENCDDPSAPEIDEAAHKLLQLRTVLEMYETFSGINRKVQFKHINRNQPNEDPRLLLILKWGGELTPMGQRQAEELGRAFRCMYPGGEGEYSSLPGSGFLRLHSTYRHDLKVYASDEGRVQMTAAAFTKGLLDLEGNLASVLVHLVKRDQAATNMLDTSTDAQDAMYSVKSRLHDIMRSPADFDSKSYSELVPTNIESIVAGMKKGRNPQEANRRLHGSISLLLDEIKDIDQEDNDFVSLYNDETLPLMINRWAKLVKDFKSSSGRFDISKIPDIYDCIKYDMLHNRSLLNQLSSATEVSNLARPLADIVIPQEYGITAEDKLDIAKKICTPLLRKIQADFHHTIVNEPTDILHRLDARLSTGVISPNRHVRSRLYFTSESHVHSLVNILRHGGLDKFLSDVSGFEETIQEVNRAHELNYMTQIVFMLYEEVSKKKGEEGKFKVDIRFSSGVKSHIDSLEEIDFWSSGSSGSLLKNSPEFPKLSTFVKRLSVDHQSGPTVLEKDSSEWRTGNRKNSAPSNIKRGTFPGMYSSPAWRRESTKKAAQVPVFNIGPNVKHKPVGTVSSAQWSTLSSQSDNTLTKQTKILHPLPAEEVSVCSFHGSIERLDSVVSELESRKDSVGIGMHGEEVPGLELATELALSIEPLVSICIAPLKELNNFLTSLTNVHVDFDAIVEPALIPHQRSSLSFLGSQDKKPDQIEEHTEGTRPTLLSL